MAGSFEVHGDGTVTVTFAYRHPTAIIQTTVEAAAHALYNASGAPVDGDGEPIAWGDLTNQDKLGIVDKFIRERIVELGRGHLHDVRQAEARALREADNATIMGEP